MFRKQKLQFSANFKRDYIAAFAVLIFFFILIVEVTLAISIPSYLHGEDAMAFQVRRLRLITSFDAVRRECASIKDQNPIAMLERQLISWDLNMLADYLRVECPKLSSSEIAELQKHVNEMNKRLLYLKTNGAYTRVNTIDASRYLNNLLNAQEIKK